MTLLVLLKLNHLQRHQFTTCCVVNQCCADLLPTKWFGQQLYCVDIPVKAAALSA